MRLLSACGAALVALSIGAFSETAQAGTLTCTSWDISGNWHLGAYATCTATLRQHSSATVYTAVEVSTDEDLLLSAGTLSFGADWDTVPLDGNYSVQWDITIYSGLDHIPTAAELAVWPASKIFRLNAASGRVNCVAPPEPICGNGALEANEMCDDGNSTSGDGCSATCTTEVCGNATVDAQEQCDDGNTVSGDGCSATCTAEICGNGVLDAEEACDDGNTINNDGCSVLCTLEFCGDGTQQGSEQCDDGNTLGGDGCSAACNLEECGNGILEGSEECDDGNSVGGDGCSGICTAEFCGNGIAEGSEQCDDGNSANGDGCSGLCNIEVCGNGVLDAGESCDDANTFAGDGCSATCAVEICGNGIIEGTEQCDDGNAINGDGCSAACVVEPPPPPPMHGCTREVNWWEDHHANARGSKRNPWPISESTRLCGDRWIDILDRSARGSAWYELAHQYIGARLNIAEGASSTPDVTAAITRAGQLLGACSISRNNRDLAEDLASLLEVYNIGQTGPGHCDGDTGHGGNDHSGHHHHHGSHGHGHHNGHHHGNGHHHSGHGSHGGHGGRGCGRH